MFKAMVLGHYRFMTYATLQQLIERYSERELRNITDPDGQTLDTVKAQLALADAASEIDGYLGLRYVLPLENAEGEPLPNASVQTLARCACDIAVYRLQTLRPSDDIKDARQRYEDVIKLLQRIGTGDVSLVGAQLRAGASTEAGDTVVGEAQFWEAGSVTATPSNFARSQR